MLGGGDKKHVPIESLRELEKEMQCDKELNAWWG
jgi:hypothetical protein